MPELPQIQCRPILALFAADDSASPLQKQFEDGTDFLFEDGTAYEFENL